MNPNPAESDTVLPADVAELLNRTPAITSALRERLARAAEEADRDPVFHANYLKGLVSQEILQALAERGETQSSLAERLGCTRQYLNKLLSEDRRVNFTLDTICSLAHLTGRRAHLVFVREDDDSVEMIEPYAFGLLWIENDFFTLRGNVPDRGFIFSSC